MFGMSLFGETISSSFMALMMTTRGCDPFFVYATRLFWYHARSFQKGVMQHVLLQKNGCEHLTVFFAGWGMDKNPFLDFRVSESDLLICFNYTDLDFNSCLLEGYKRVRVVAWSLGVWAVSSLMDDFPVLAENAIAVNGTPFPVDETRGIPPNVFQGTLEGLSNASLARFDRRMCGDAATLAAYTRVHPKRSVESLVEELAWIGRESTMRKVSPPFKRAIVGKRDAIFSCDNQENAWRGLCPVDVIDAAHYSHELLRSVICGGGEYG